MTLVIFEIHKYVHLLKTLFSFLFSLFHLSTLRSARSDAFLRSIGAQALRGGPAKNLQLSARHAVTLCLAKNLQLFHSSILHPLNLKLFCKKREKILQVRKIITIFADVKHTLKAPWAEGWADTYI